MLKFTGIKDLSFQTQIETFNNTIQTIITSKYPQIKLELANLTVEFSNRMTLCAGKAQLRKNVIKLSYPLHKQNPHELCHFAAIFIYGKNMGHKKEWKLLMRLLHLREERCHNMDTSGLKRKVNRFVYSCQCKEHLLSTRLHNNIKSGSIYNCKKCKSNLKYKHQAAKQAT